LRQAPQDIDELPLGAAPGQRRVGVQDRAGRERLGFEQGRRRRRKGADVAGVGSRRLDAADEPAGGLSRHMMQAARQQPAQRRPHADQGLRQRIQAGSRPG